MTSVHITHAAKKLIKREFAALGHAQPVVIVWPEPVEADFTRTGNGRVEFAVQAAGRWFAGVSRGSSLSRAERRVEVGSISVYFLEMPKVPPSNLIIGYREGKLYGITSA